MLEHAVESPLLLLLLAQVEHMVGDAIAKRLSSLPRVA